MKERSDSRPLGDLTIFLFGETHMKKVLAGTIAAAAIAVALTAPTSANNAAVRIDDFGCGAFVPTENGGIGTPLVAAAGDHSVSTHGGITKLVCHFDIPAGDEPARATRADFGTTGLLCGTNGGSTADWKLVATPGGRATLTCMVKKN